MKAIVHFASIMCGLCTSPGDAALRQNHEELSIDQIYFNIIVAANDKIKMCQISFTKQDA